MNDVYRGLPPVTEVVRRLREPASAEKREERVRRFLEKLTGQQDVVELRILGERTLSGYFRDREALVQTILEAEEQQLGGVYWTPQRLCPDLHKRNPEQLKRPGRGDLTSDREVERYRYLLVDFDPERKTNTSSSDRELGEAVQVAVGAVRDLTTEGWPAPTAWACSGNGVHLFFPIDLPTSKAELLNRTLKAIGKRFDTAIIKSDSTVSNPSRIFRAYGTTNRKGDATAERPHRQACLLPMEWLEISDCAGQLLTEAKMEAFASENAQSRKGPKPRRVRASQADDKPEKSEGDLWADLIAQEGRCRVRPPVDFNGGRKWVLTGCPLDSSHDQDNGAVLIEHVDGGLSFTCHHSRCQGKTMANLRRYFVTLYTSRGQELPELLEGIWGEFAPLPDPSHTPKWIYGCMPAPLEDFTDAISSFNQTPPSMSKTLSLAFLACAAQGRYEVRSEGRAVNLAMYVCVGADSGERKSSDFGYLQHPLEEYKKKSLEITTEKQSEIRAEKDVLKAKTEVLFRLARDGGADELKEYQDAVKEYDRVNQVVPIDPLIDDTTPEALAHVMREQGGTAALMSPEGGPLNGVRARYSDSSFCDYYLKFFSGESASVKRKKESIDVYRPSLVIGVATQTEHLYETLRDRELGYRGFLPRFLLDVPRSRMGYRDKCPPVPPALTHRYQEMFFRLLPEPGYRNPGVWVQRAPLRLSENGQAAIDYLTYKDIEPRLREDGDLFDLKVWVTRLPTLALKVAALWHVCSAAYANESPSEYIGDIWVHRAIIWAKEYALPMALKAYGHELDDARLTMARRIAKILLKDGRPEWKWDDLRTNHFKRVKADEVKAGMSALEERNIVREKEAASSRKSRGRPPAVYEVNPLFLEDPELPPGDEGRKLAENTANLSGQPRRRTFELISGDPANTAYMCFFTSSSSLKSTYMGGKEGLETYSQGSPGGKGGNSIPPPKPPEIESREQSDPLDQLEGVDLF